jgi:uncharacterized protein
MKRETKIPSANIAMSLVQQAKKGDDATRLIVGGSLVQFYGSGKGTPKQRAEALKWVRSAAKEGNATAQYYLGRAYAEGNDISKNVGKAVEWYKKAAENGDVDAQLALGLIYEFGDGVPASRAKAIKWYSKAANQGCDAAKMILQDFET